MSPAIWTVVSVLITLNGSWVACNECNDGDYAPVPYDCNGYLQCEFRRWVQRHCATSLHFNRFVLACDFPWNANCELLEPTTTSTTTTTVDPIPVDPTPVDPTPTDPPTDPPTGLPTQPPTTTTTAFPSTTTTTTTTTASTTTTTPPGSSTTTTITQPPPTNTHPPPTNTHPPTTSTLLPTLPPILECTPHDGPFVLHLPHPNCTMFYKCVHGVPHEMLCPFDQHWAIAQDRCESPSEANCVDGAAREQSNARPPNYW